MEPSHCARRGESTAHAFRRSVPARSREVAASERRAVPVLKRRAGKSTYTLTSGFPAWFFYFLALRLGYLLLDISVPICRMGMISTLPNRVIV